MSAMMAFLHGAMDRRPLTYILIWSFLFVLAHGYSIIYLAMLLDGYTVQRLAIWSAMAFFLTTGFISMIPIIIWLNLKLWGKKNGR